MDKGLLWFDDNPRVSFAVKVQNAARRYRERFGKSPNVCYVHPQTWSAASVTLADLQVITSNTVRPDHFWVGVK